MNRYRTYYILQYYYIIEIIFCFFLIIFLIKLYNFLRSTPEQPTFLTLTDSQNCDFFYFIVTVPSNKKINKERTMKHYKTRFHH